LAFTKGKFGGKGSKEGVKTRRDQLWRSYRYRVGRFPTASRRTLHGLTVLLLVLLSLLSGCSARDQAHQAKVPAIAVEVAPVIRGDFQEVLRLSGELEPWQEAYLVPVLAGTVKKVLVQTGDRVQPGQTIIELDDTDIRLQVEQAAAALAAAKAALQRAEEGAQPEELAQLEAAVAQAEANYQQAETDYGRLKTLYEEGAVARQLFEQAELRLTVAASQLEQARSALELARRGTPPSQLAALQAQVDQAQAAYRLAQRRLADTKLQAPFGGIVAMVEATVGQRVAPGTVVARVVEMSRVRLLVGVDASVVNRLVPGATAQVWVPALQQAVKGTILSVAPAADPRFKQFPVEIEIPNPDGRLKPGMLAEAQLVIERREDVLLVPLAAVIKDPDGQLVFVVEDDIARQRRVTVGPDDGTWVVILDGLAEGELVVVSGQEFLADGVRIEVQRGPEGGSTP